jgi:uncharacterized repeat protein (TIGR03809 family)
MIKSSGSEHDIVVRWRVLAAQRLDYLTELHLTGRWQLYHREDAFLDMVKETRTALQTWERLVRADDARNETAEVQLMQAMDEVSESPANDIGESLLAGWALSNGVGADYDLRES